MRSLFLMYCAFSGLLLVTATEAFAEISFRQGVVSARKMPAPVISEQLVVLDVPHKSQGRDPLCVPTSASIILAYFGENHDKWRLKALAENHKPAAKRNKDFT